MSHIQFCGDCQTYTLRDSCKECGSATSTPHPPKFSPEDRYGKYRRQLKAMTEGE